MTDDVNRRIVVVCAIEIIADSTSNLLIDPVANKQIQVLLYLLNGSVNDISYFIKLILESKAESGSSRKVLKGIEGNQLFIEIS